MDNASDRKSIRRKEKQSRIADNERRAVIGTIMSTAPGRAWLWDTLSGCLVFSTTFTAEPYTSSFNEGRRSVGLSLLADIMAHCPDQYIQAMREANERSITDTVRSESDANASAADAERRGSTEPDGGDSGREPDRGETSDAFAKTDGWDAGASIYS